MGKGNAGADPNGKSITDATFKAAADAMSMSAEESMKNTHDLLAKKLSKKTE
ncbi:MAG: hypothetical protein UX35_C0016G0007 [Microgenomates group bacterium GW2011_GWA1_46_15]|nr:MAG: hypothetical protein UX00_C0015G0008 [Microgenomates group bacterium GW2011_GWB1_45_17]KKU22763.1 MAG: hypothetical protein UX35_C0016G0007 [Microgenomates group bacterium GW2011_GWA1_46_15]KKU24025.1 MAG: hypothetical protein UX36_C0002G0008 [Microgenomates group bacterium GW2011_GWC1_46_15]